MKKFLYMIGLVSLVFTFSTSVDAAVFFTNSQGIEMTETEYNNLLSLSFTEDQIDRMDYQTFIDNKDMVGEIVASTNKFFKITTTIRNGIKEYSYQEVTEAEATGGAQAQMQGQGQMQGPGYSPNADGTFYDGLSIDAYRSMQSYIVSVGDFMFLKVDVQWLTMPSVRSADIIGIGYESDKVHRASSINFRSDWKTGNDVLDYTDVCAPKYENTGSSVMFELPSGTIVKLEAYAYVYVYKNTGVGTLTSLTVVGDYAHATETVDYDDVYDYYTVNIGAGIDMDSPYHNSYESSQSADALFLGTW